MPPRYPAHAAPRAQPRARRQPGQRREGEAHRQEHHLRMAGALVVPLAVVVEAVDLCARPAPLALVRGRHRRPAQARAKAAQALRRAERGSGAELHASSTLLVFRARAPPPHIVHFRRAHHQCGRPHAGGRREAVGRPRAGEASGRSTHRSPRLCARGCDPPAINHTTAATPRGANVDPHVDA